APVSRLYTTCDLGGRKPRGAIVVAVSRKHAAGISTGIIMDHLFAIRTEVPGHEQVHAAGVSIHHRRRIAAGVRPVPPHNLRRAPSAPTIVASAQKEVDSTMVRGAFLPTFAEGQQGTAGGACDGWNSVCSVAVSAPFPQLHMRGNGHSGGSDK